MRIRRKLGLVAFVLAVLGICQIARADSISPYALFWPGLIFLNLPYAFPASLLAAFVERPFFSAAGITTRPLVLSLRANFLSLLAGLLLIPIGFPALYVIGPFWCLFAFTLSCFIEIRYVRRYVPSAKRWLIILANAASSLLLIFVPLLAEFVKNAHPLWGWLLRPFEVSMFVAVSIASLVVFLLRFLWPVKRPADLAATRAKKIDGPVIAVRGPAAPVRDREPVKVMA